MTATSQRWIDFYLSRGYTLTPLNGKIPQIKKWQSTQYDPFFSTGGNFGIVLQDDDLVVDIDPRNGGTIPALLDGVKTFIVKTGGGGWHYYFKKPKDKDIAGLLKDYPGVEFKTKGQQVVGAGCVTTGEYVAIADIPVANAPDGLLYLLTQKKEAPKKTDKKIEYTSDPQTQERFTHYLQSCPVAIEGMNGDKTTFMVACHGRDLGLDEMTTAQLMCLHYNPKCQPPWPAEEILIKVNNAYKYAQNDAGNLSPVADFEALEKSTLTTGAWEFGKDGITLKPTFKNLLMILAEDNTELTLLFRFNEFTDDIEFTRESPWHKTSKDSKSWTDPDAVMLKEWITNKHNFSPDVQNIHEAVLAISKRSTYHPIKDYLQSLKWDGKARVRTWLIDYLKAEDSPYTRAVSELVLTAMCIRVFKPGTKFDYMMVLEGPQGMGKSRVCKALGGQWHSEARLDPHNKDLVDIIRSKWVIEIAEMDVSSKAETNAIKAFLSRDTDRVRLSYARTTRDFPRQCVVIGTYNPIDGESTYLKDPTGNRRFWPIQLPDGQIDVERFASDRDQLLAEALIISRTYDANRLNWLGDPEAEKIRHKVQKEKTERDPWHDLIEAYAEKETTPGQTLQCVSVFCLCIGGKYENFGVREAKRISNVFRAMGWAKTYVWNAEKQNSSPGWKRPFPNNTKKDLDTTDIQ